MKPNRIIIFVVCCTATVLGACQTVSPSPVAARLLTPSKEARQELRETTAKILGLGAVTLDENTLINSSQFAYARKPRYDTSDQLLQGRVIEPVHVFRLVIREGACWLVYQNKNQQVLLSRATCIAE